MGGEAEAAALIPEACGLWARSWMARLPCRTPLVEQGKTTSDSAVVLRSHAAANAARCFAMEVVSTYSHSHGDQQGGRSFSQQQRCTQSSQYLIGPGRRQPTDAATIDPAFGSEAAEKLIEATDPLGQ